MASAYQLVLKYGIMLQDMLNNRNKSATLSSLTSLRFFAALLVVIHHVRTTWGHFAITDLLGQIGWLGVSFFFILSGFVLMWSYNSDVLPGLYIYRRLTRIYPLHLFGLILSITAFAATGIPFGGYIGNIPGTIANALLIHDWIPGHPNIRQAWNGVSWTLSAEFFFYLTAPFIFPAIARAQWQKLFLWIGVSWLAFIGVDLAAQAHGWQAFLDFFQYHPAPRMIEFIAGAAGAQAVKFGLKYKSRALSALFMFAPVLVYCSLVPEVLRCPALMTLLLIPGALLLIISTANVDIAQTKTWTAHPTLVLLGDSSFALYIIHAILLRLFVICLYLTVPAGMRAGYIGEVWTVVFVCLAVPLSVVVHQRLEMPVRQRLLKMATTR